MPNTNAEWPIKVGGEYVQVRDSRMHARVHGLHDGQVFYRLIYAMATEYRKAGTVIEQVHNVLEDVFRKMYSPEDQSLIPAPVAALKAWREYEEGFSSLSYSEVQTMVSAALQSAGELPDSDQLSKVINHRDGDPTNNVLGNLEVVEVERG